MKKILLFVVSVLAAVVTGCGSLTHGEYLKAKSNASIVEVVGNLNYQEGKAIDTTNILRAKFYNKQIASIAPATDTKKTNFVADIDKVQNQTYQANMAIQDELDKANAELKQYKRWFGLHGVLLGFKQFSRDILYSTIGLTILFVLLRIFANSSPILIAIWNVINSVVAYFINIFAKFFPNIMDKIGDETLTLKNLFARIKGIFIKKQ